jgi:NTE family protein
MLLLSLLLVKAVSQETRAPEKAAGNVTSAFPENDPFRIIVDPLQFGIEGFEKRIAAIKSQGREPLGLVLAGGSARAYAHIGVLAGLEEMGIRPDFIVANSMGAVVGMLYSAGLSPALIEMIVETIPPEYYLNLVIPTKGGFINSDPFVAAAKHLVGDIDLAETRIPIIVTAEDLASRRQVELASGDFSTVMATTFAIPAIFEPVSFNGYRLVDGGTTNLVPVEIAARYTTKLIVSSALYAKTMDFANPITVLNRAFDIGKTRAGMAGLIEFDPFVIRNHVEDISYMEFSAPAEIISRGRKSTLARAADLRAYLGADQSAGAYAPGLEDARKKFETSIPAIVSLFKRGAFPEVAPSVRYALRLKYADDYERTAFPLEGGAFVGAAVYGSTGRIKASLMGLFSAAGEAGKQWGALAGLYANPFDSLRASAEFRIWGDFSPWPEFFFKPLSIETRAALDWRSEGDSAYFEPYAYGGFSYSDSGGFEWDCRTGLGFSYIPKASESFFSMKGGAFALSDSAGLSFGPEATFKAGIAIKDLAATRLRAFGRYGFGVDTRLDSADAFRGLAPSNFSPFVAVANLDAVWLAKPLEFSLGELILINGVELGPFLDCAWASELGPAPASLSGGLSLNFTASFAGLKPFEFSIFGGIQTGALPVLGIRSSRLFPHIQR